MLTREASTPTVAEVLHRAASRTERAQGPAVDALAAARVDREELGRERSRS